MPDNDDKPLVTEPPENSKVESARTPATDFLSAGVGLAFWFGLFGLLFFIFYRSAEPAAVFLDIRSERPLVIRGIVQNQAAPAADGLVRITIEDAKKDRFIVGVVLPPDANGQFTTEKMTLLTEAESRGPLRITAYYAGKGIKGEAIAHVNYDPPFLGRYVWWLSSSGGLVLTLLLIFLFTGEMGKTKARLLFSAMYFTTFMSLAIPLWITVLLFQNQALIEILESSPIGLVKGRAEGLTEPQWLVNIGGTVYDGRLVPPAGKRDRAAEPPAKAAPPAQAPPAVEPAPPAADPSVQIPPARSEEKAGTGAAALSADYDAAGGRTVYVKGGLTIPFFVIALAMLGAGINLTRKVPEIQQKYDLEVLPQQEFLRYAVRRVATLGFARGSPTTYAEPDSPEARGTVRKMAAGIRRELVENFMYLMSAPFLAVAVYYLLRILTTEGDVSQPILVLMAFATGLTSDTMVKAIIQFAKDKLGDKDKDKQGGSAPAAADPPANPEAPPPAADTPPVDAPRPAANQP